MRAASIVSVVCAFVAGTADAGCEDAASPLAVSEIIAIRGSPAARRQAEELIRDSYEAEPKIFEVPSETRSEVVAMLLLIASQDRGADITIGSTMVSPGGAASALIRLGEQEFICEYTEHYRKINGQTLDDVLRSGRHPLVIAYLAPALFESDYFRSTRVGGDVSFSALPVACARFILHNLQLPAFSPLVRERAGELLKSSRKEELVNATRRWWNANEAYFKAKQYGEVRPPEAVERLPATR